MSVSLTLRSLQRGSLLSFRRASLTGFRALHATPRRSELYPNADLATFSKVVGTQDRLVLVDFYADWCGPCRQLSPILEKFSTDASIKSGSELPIDVVKINTENETVLPLVQQFKVHALPTVIAFRNGEPVDNFVGMRNEAGLKRFLETV
ncbi:hypothetical protein E4T56_gene15218 [Termitomyces sp. T112]|nr:hypothetical protein E4T56_gene15218 [Termitomyces sp. T112]KAH0583549.1 hypothetical protein H2248_009175 [Termitomyces sp. 'cryptogamus']KNZ73794.1 Thioredoxin, mitochondrial [Termitomyces sp. J132]